MQDIDVRQNHRITYVEPTNIVFRDDDTIKVSPSTTRINNPYEDYDIAVDLTIDVFDRQSCGGKNVDGDNISVVYTASRATESFFKGTNGVLTTNYTDINLITDSELNTEECLGLESLNISYQSWMYPEVTARFVDVRGSSVMIEEEENLHGDSSKKSMYKAFFSFPYPLFKLQVKGFYGIGATFYLTVEDVKISFDANSGNFVFDVKFIGMMYRIYTDMPMIYCCVAPYMTAASDYWNNNVTNKFVFINSNGSKTPMIKFPELQAKIFGLDTNVELKEIKSSQVSESENYDEKIELYKSVSERIPSETKDLDNIIIGNGILGKDGRVFFIFGDDSKWSDKKEEIKKYKESVEKCDNSYSTHFMEKFGGFFNNYTDAKHVKLKKNKNGEWDSDEDFEKYLTKEAQNFVKKSTNGNKINVYIVDASGSDFQSLKASIDAEIEVATKSKNATEERFHEEIDRKTEEILGFRPSIKNFYNLAFAHMDTFMYAYNNMLGNIKSQLDAQADNRKFAYFGITDNKNGDFSTDIESVYESLPPFPAIYTKKSTQTSVDNNGVHSQNRTVELWPGELQNGDDMEEVKFVKDLLAATKLYVTELDAVNEKQREILEAASGSGNTNDVNISFGFMNFIPLTPIDVGNFGIFSNPYNTARGLAMQESDDFDSTLVFTLVNRLFYYLATYVGSNISTAAKTAGIIEAVNLYKSFGCLNSKKFLTFLQQYILDDSGAEIKQSITSTSSDSTITSAWKDLTSGSSLYKVDNLNLLYNKHTCLPITTFSLNTVKSAYIDNSCNKSNAFVRTTNTNSSKTTTFSISDNGNIANEYFTQLDETINQVTKIKVSEEDKSDDGKLDLVTETDISALKSNYNTVFQNNPYPQDTFVKKNENGEFVLAESSNIVKILNYEESRENYYVKFPTYAWTQELSNAYSATRDIYGKAYMFLLNLKTNVEYFHLKFTKNGKVLKSSLLREAAILYRRMQYNETNTDIVTNTGHVIPGYDKIHTLSTEKRGFSFARSQDDYENYKVVYDYHYSSSRANVLVKYFKNWVNSKFKQISSFATINDGNRLLTMFAETPDGKNMKLYQDVLKDLFFSTVSVNELLINSLRERVSGGYLGDNPRPNTMFTTKGIMDIAIDGFVTAMKKIYKDINPTESDDLSNQLAQMDIEDPFKNKDIKLSTYITLKNLYDRWLCNPYKGENTWRYGVDGSDFNSFMYIDSLYHDIGYKILINTNRATELIASCMPSSELNASYGSSVKVSKSVFEYLAELAEHTGGFLIAFPQKIGMGSVVSDMAKMFKAIPYMATEEWKNDSSSFVYMYNYKPSEHLGTDQYKNDGIIDLLSEDIADSFNDSGYTVPAFGVTFAKQNQSFFKNLQLNTESTTVTEASLAAASNIASRGSEAPKEMSFFGQDLYKVRTSYSYECSFEMMGNIQVMPLMYFQLNNVPFWRGAYLIYKVSHSITPGNMTTNVTGVRINKNCLPITDGAVLESGGEVGASRSGDNYGSNGPMYQGQFVEDDTYIPQNTKDVDDFNPSLVNEKHPLICITPGYGPNFTDKTALWKMSYDMVEDYLIPKLKAGKYKDGTAYNVQFCNKDGNHTTNNTCSMVQTENYISKFGSKCVISVVPRFNTGSSNYFKVFYGGKNKSGTDVATPESEKLAKFFVSEVKEMLTKEKELKSATPGMFNKTESTGILMESKTKGKDFGTSLQCASVATYNWFDGYPADEICRKALTRTALAKTRSYKEKDSQGRFKISQGWLYSEEGMKTLANMHYNAIKKYIDSIT